MKRNWKLIYYSILSSTTLIPKKITNKPFQKGSHINNTFLKGGFYFFQMPRKRKSQLPNISHCLSLKWYQIEFPIIFNIICIFLSTLWFLDCKRNFSYRTQYTLTFTMSGTNLSRHFTNVSKILSAINANIFNINTFLIEKGYTSRWGPLTVLILLKTTV